MELTPDQIKILGIFFPDHLRALKDVGINNQRFVHYTGADVAISIFENKCVWMRNATVMNDFSEIQHGTDCLISTYRSGIGNHFKSLIDEISPGISTHTENLFDSWLPIFKHETYLTCFSEHDEIEDKTGRLSMWRAYAPRNGVALVFRNTRFLAPTNQLKANSSPVVYADRGVFQAKFEAICNNIDRERFY